LEKEKGIGEGGRAWRKGIEEGHRKEKKEEHRRGRR
jgi:hypothetical protein